MSTNAWWTPSFRIHNLCIRGQRQYLGFAVVCQVIKDWNTYSHSVSSSEEALLYSFCRLSDDKALEKLHQILIFRELDLPLSVIPPGSGVASPCIPLRTELHPPCIPAELKMVPIPIIISTMIACGNGSDVLRSFPHDTAASDECADQLSVRQGSRYDRDRSRVEGAGF